MEEWKPPEPEVLKKLIKKFRRPEVQTQSTTAVRPKDEKEIQKVETAVNIVAQDPKAKQG